MPGKRVLTPARPANDIGQHDALAKQRRIKQGELSQQIEPIACRSSHDPRAVPLLSYDLLVLGCKITTWCAPPPRPLAVEAIPGRRIAPTCRWARGVSGIVTNATPSHPSNLHQCARQLPSPPLIMSSKVAVAEHQSSKGPRHRHTSARRAWCSPYPVILSGSLVSSPCVLDSDCLASLLYPVPTAAHACPRSSIPSSLGVSNHITQPPFPRCTPHLDFAGLLALLAGRRRWRPGPGPGPGSGSGSAQVVLLSGSGFAHLPLHH